MTGMAVIFPIVFAFVPFVILANAKTDADRRAGFIWLVLWVIVMGAIFPTVVGMLILIGVMAIMVVMVIPYLRRKP